MTTRKAKSQPKPGVLIDVARTVSADRGFPAIVTLIVLSLLGCVATHPPDGPPARGRLPLSPSFWDPEEVGRQPRPAMVGLETGTMFFGIVPDAVGIRRYVAASEVVPEARTPVFGILTTDAAGDPQFVAAAEVPNVESQSYGWFIWVGDSTQPVRWTERSSLTRPPARGSTVESKPSIFSSDNGGMAISQAQTRVHLEITSISPDGSAAITRAKSTPLDGFIWNSWVVEPGDPPGRYEIAVSLSGGRTETFSFALGQPQGTHPSIEFCPYMDVYLNWWWAKHTLDGGPDESEISARALTVFSETLMLEHAFSLVEKVEDAYWVASATARRNVMNPEMAHRYVKMRTLSQFQGKAVRPTNFTPGDTIDPGFLFEVPLAELDAYIRGMAHRFADRLFPHARRLCAEWRGGQLKEDAPFERIREELTEDIERVRRERVASERRKLLELEVVEPPTP